MLKYIAKAKKPRKSKTFLTLEKAESWLAKMGGGAITRKSDFTKTYPGGLFSKKI